MEHIIIYWLKTRI